MYSNFPKLKTMLMTLNVIIYAPVKAPKESKCQMDWKEREIRFT